MTPTPRARTSSGRTSTRSGLRRWSFAAVGAGLLAGLVAWATGLPPPLRSGAVLEGRRAGQRDADAILNELLGAAPACRAETADAARRLGATLEQSGRARAESALVRPADGPRAARELAEARACFERAGEARGADELRAHERRARTRVADELRTRQLALDRVKQNKKPSAALAEVRALRALFDGRRGGYAAWLAQEERRLLESEPK